VQLRASSILHRHTMPPRKRAKVSAASTPLAEQPKTPIETPADTTPAAGKEQSVDQTADLVLNDPWTDEQEAQLFKSLIRWKPTGTIRCCRCMLSRLIPTVIGIHKHFRMICISQNMRSTGYANDDPTSAHARTPGIWAKLNQLYDLDRLDDRENGAILASMPDPADTQEGLLEFKLPEDDFGDLMWYRRFRSEGSSSRESSPLLPDLLVTANDPPPIQLGQHSKVLEAEKEDTVSQSSPPAKTRGSAKSRAAPRTGRAGRTAQTRAGSKAQSAVSESEEDDEEDEEDEDDEDESGDELAQQKTTRVSQRRKSARGKRGK
jgi:MRG-binding protein